MAYSKRSKSKARRAKRRNPMGDTWAITHAPAPHAAPYPAPIQNPRKRKARKRKSNPSYKATFTSSADRAPVRKALKASGFSDIKLREATKGKKRAAGPYAKFVKAQMPALMKNGMSAGEAMKAVGALWRQKGARANPSMGIPSLGMSVYGNPAMGMSVYGNPAGSRRRRSKKRHNGTGRYAVVKWSHPGDTSGRVLSRHDTLKEAQAAHKAIVLKHGQLIRDYQLYGIEG